MKRSRYVLLFALFTAMLLLCGFKAQEITPFPEYPDAALGMTAEEVLEAFDVTAKDVTVYHESDISIAFSIDNGSALSTLPIPIRRTWFSLLKIWKRCLETVQTRSADTEVFSWMTSSPEMTTSRQII